MVQEIRRTKISAFEKLEIEDNPTATLVRDFIRNNGGYSGDYLYSLSEDKLSYLIYLIRKARGEA